MKFLKSTGVKKISLLLLFIFISILVIFPLYALLIGSLKPSRELFRFGFNLKLEWDIMSFQNYLSIFEGKGSAKYYFVWYKNSVVISVVYTVLSLLLSSMVGYALAVYRFIGRQLIFMLVLVLMIIPVEIIILPLYQLMIKLKLINTIWGVILPFIVSPLPIFFFRQFALGLPKDFMDAGRMDGCSEYGIYFRIMMPLMLPAFGAMAILQALNSWNNFLWPLIVLRTTEQFTLPIGLASLLTPYGNNYDVLIAGSVLAILPILLLFVLFQKYFIEGLTAGGIKG